MIRITFTPEGIDALERERYNHRNPKAQRRREVLYLKGLGQPNNQIKESCGISGPTLAGYLTRIQLRSATVNEVLVLEKNSWGVRKPKVFLGR